MTASPSSLLPRIAGIFVATLGALVYLGWTLDIASLKTILPGLVSMKVNTAAGMLLAGVALCALADVRAHRVPVWMASLPSLLVFGLGLATLSQEVLGNLGIDEMLHADDVDALFTAHPGRMSILTSVDFLAMGVSLLMLCHGKRVAVAQGISIATLVVAIIPLMGYLFGHHSFPTFGAFTAMAPLTGIGFIALSAGVLVMTKEHGVLARLREYLQSVTFYVAMLLLALCGVATYVDTVRLIESNDLLNKSEELHQSIETIGEDLDVATAAFRGLLLSGNRQFETELDASIDELSHSLATLKKLAADHSVLQASMQQLDELLKRRVEYFERNVQLISESQGNEKPDIDIMRSEDIGRQIHTVLQDMHVIDDSLREQKRSDSRARVRSVFVALAFTAVFGLMMLFLVFAGLRREVAMRRNSEASLKKMNAELEYRVQEKLFELRDKDLMLIEQSRRAAMGEMIGNIAHQWRQPLSILGLSFQNMRDDFMDGELDEKSMKTYVDKAMCIVQRMSDTIDDFRDFFRPDNAMVSFGLREAVKKTIALMDGSLVKYGVEVRISPEFDTDCHHAILRGHLNKFEQVLLNILGNAKDVLIERKVPAGVIDISCRCDEEAVSLIVRDNGGGIPPDVLPKIFDPYFTTKGSGTGIGLYMSRMIMDHMGGHIEAGNGPDGAEFILTFPVAMVSERSLDARSSDNQATP